MFAGQRVTERGLVYQVELEGSRSQLRIQAAKQFAGISERLPIVHVTKIPPALIGAGKRVSNEWKKWASAIVRKAKAAAERFGVPLKLVTIDPQNHFAGDEMHGLGPDSGNTSSQKNDEVPSPHMGVIPEITIALYYIAGWELCSASQSWLSTIVIVALLFRVAPLERCLRKPFIDSRQRLLALGSYVTRSMVDRELRICRGYRSPRWRGNAGLRLGSRARPHQLWPPQ